MRIDKYGIILERLSVDTIELLRQWRNDPKVYQFMEFRDYINPEMQKTWFSKLNDACDYYFIVELNGVKIGMVNIKSIDWEQKCGEPGIFMYDDSVLNTDIAFRASCALMDFCFDTLHLEKVEGHVLRDNKRAQRFNKFIGYTLQPNQDTAVNQLYTLTKQSYLARRPIVTSTFASE